MTKPAQLAELADTRAAAHRHRPAARLSPAQTHLLLEQVELRRRATAKFTQAEQCSSRASASNKRPTNGSPHTKPPVSPERAGSSAGRHHRRPLLRHRRRPISTLSGRMPPQSASTATQSPHTSPPSNRAQPFNDRHRALRSNDFARLAHRPRPPSRRPPHHLARMRRAKPRHPRPHARDKVRTPRSSSPRPRKCPPWSERCELEWISRDRECRQLVAWHGGASTSPPANTSATVSRNRLRSSAAHHRPAHPSQPIPSLRQPDRYIFDIDPAVARRSLKGVSPPSTTSPHSPPAQPTSPARAQIA